VETSVETPQGVTVRDLLNAGLHFGHQTKRWNPKMKRYIFDKRNGIHIVDLAKRLVKLQEAQEFVRGAVSAGEKILFVGTKKQAQNIIKDAATACGHPYVTFRWLGGTLTNNATIRRSVARMRELEKIEGADNFGSVPKKEASMLRHELEKLRRNLSGIAAMTSLPGAMFVVDINREAIAVAEANRLGIPVLAIVDTNCDPDPINYVIPGNDDSMRAIKLIADTMSATVKEAEKAYAKNAAALAKQREAEEAKARAEAKAEAKARADAKADAEEAKAKADAAEAKDKVEKARKKAADEKKPVSLAAAASDEKKPVSLAAAVEEELEEEELERGHRKGKKAAILRPGKSEKEE
jgi:small subunit ribosomal protein S2